MQALLPAGAWSSEAHVAPLSWEPPQGLAQGPGSWGASWLRNAAQASRQAGFSREVAGLDLGVAAPDFSKLAVQSSHPVRPVRRLPPGSHGSGGRAPQTCYYSGPP